MQVIPIPCLTDNYAYIIKDNNTKLIINSITLKKMRIFEPIISVSLPAIGATAILTSEKILNKKPEKTILYPMPCVVTNGVMYPIVFQDWYINNKVIIETKNTGFLNIFICTTGNSVCSSWYINIGIKTTNIDNIPTIYAN